jgi:GABA(A) receptor-associated protein
MSSYQTKTTLEERIRDSNKIAARYPTRIPIICERASNATDTPELSKVKFLIERKSTFSQFIMTIRKQLDKQTDNPLPAEKALFFIIDGIIPPTSAEIGDLYDQHKNKEDNFLYVSYSSESTFG